MILSLLALALPAAAQTSREAVDQMRSDRFRPDVTSHEFKPEESVWRRWFGNMHGSYAVTLMGPRFIGNSNETYNLYVPDVAPIQLYHSGSIYFQVSPTFTAGFGVDAVQNISDGVIGETGIIRGQSFQFYDPTINFTFPNPFTVPGWWITNSASFSLAVTDPSIAIGRVTQLNYWSNWRVLTYPSPWNYGFDINLNPQFYTQPMPAGFTFRKTFYMSIGTFLSYQVSPVVTLSHTTTFDFAHYEGRDMGLFNFSSDLADRTRFNLIVSPHVFPLYLSLTGYIQFLIWDMRPETTITGLGFSVSF